MYFPISGSPRFSFALYVVNGGASAAGYTESTSTNCYEISDAAICDTFANPGAFDDSPNIRQYAHGTTCSAIIAAGGFTGLDTELWDFSGNKAMFKST